VRSSREQRNPRPTNVGATIDAQGHLRVYEEVGVKESTSVKSRSAQVETANEAARENRFVAASDSSESRSRGATRASGRSALVHVVRPQETLRSIARDRLGNSRRANEIAELNEDRLAESGGVPAAGQTLILPSDAAPLRQPR
jgi:nucleoid-associated protein YgaU